MSVLTNLGEMVKFHELMLRDAQARLKAAKGAVKRQEDNVLHHRRALDRLDAHIKEVQG